MKDRTICASRRPSATGDGDRCPQIRVQLPAELLHQPELVLGQLDVTFRDQHLTMSWLHPQKAHREDYVKERRPSTSTGPGPAPSPLKPFLTAAAASSLAVRAAWSGVSPQASRAASTEEWVQPDP